MLRNVRAALNAAMIGLATFGLTTSALAGDTPSYNIVSQDGKDDGLRVSVRLDARQTPADLKAIFEDVKARLPASKRVAKVSFFLSATSLTDKPWAEMQGAAPTADIFGLRLDEENAYRAELASDTRQRIGAWLTSPPALPGRLVIFKARGKVYAEWLLRNGQKTTDEVFEQRTRAGRRFEISGGDGGYYRLDNRGNLELGSGAAVIAVAEPILPLPQSPAQSPVQAGNVPLAADIAAARAETVKPGDSNGAPAHAATDAPHADAADDTKPIRKRVSAPRAKHAERPTRRADVTGDAIQRALSH